MGSNLWGDDFEKICHWFSLPNTLPKGSVFFFPGNSLFFGFFWGKSSEWVKNPFFFFSGPGKKKRAFHLSEWVKVNFSWEKKNRNLAKSGRKKKTSQTWFSLIKNKESPKFLSEWLTNYSWEEKKNTCFFFLPLFRKKKKTLFPNLSEWVTPKLIPGKKNATFGLTTNVFMNFTRFRDFFSWA